ncbi:M15 family metallopeptidase [Lactobacillaceae bacterium Melli_B4]
MKNEKLAQPIPIDMQSWDWQLAHDPIIKENNEPLVKAGFYPEKIMASPEYFNQNIDGALIHTYVRRGVYDKLVQASDLLPAGYKFLLLDVWRSNRAQQSIFDILKQQLASKYPELSKDELLKRVLTTVAPPSDDIENKPSPHNTGGAVDLTIVNEVGIPLDFGTKFDAASEIARTTYFEERTRVAPLTNEQETYLNNRRLLFNIMTAVGFTNYTNEWWHYDYGNQNWAWKTNHPHAIYGAASPEFTWQNPLNSDWPSE